MVVLTGQCLAQTCLHSQPDTTVHVHQLRISTNPYVLFATTPSNPFLAKACSST